MWFLVVYVKEGKTLNISSTSVPYVELQEIYVGYERTEGQKRPSKEPDVLGE